MWTLRTAKTTIKRGSSVQEGWVKAGMLAKIFKITATKAAVLVILASAFLLFLQFAADSVFIPQERAQESRVNSLLYSVQESTLNIERFDYDRRIRGSVAGRAPDPRVVVLRIDEPSIQAFGQFPFDRKVYAALIQKLTELRTRVLAFDIVFAEEERNEFLAELKEILVELQQKGVKGPALEVIGNRAQESDSTNAFLQVINPGLQVIWGFPFNIPMRYSYLNHEEARDNYGDKGQVAPSMASAAMKTVFKGCSGCPNLDNTSVGYGMEALLPYQTLLHSTVKPGSPATIGFFNADADNDSVIRRVPVIMKHRGLIFPALSVAAVQRYMGKEFILKFATDFDWRLHMDANQELIVPIDYRGEALVNYYGPPQTVKTLELADVIAGKHDGDELAGKIVFLGVTATGLKDLRATPFTKDFPGVEVHAQFASNILQQSFIQKGADYYGVGLLFIIVVGVGIAAVAFRFHPGWAILATAVALFGVDFAAEWYFTHGLYVSSIIPSLAALTMMFAGVMYRYISSESEKKFVREAFSRYVSGAVVDEILKDQSKLRLGGEKRELTVLFSDMVGFTKLSEGLDAGQLTQLLNEYFSRMTKIILENQGTLDKYIGDAIMCFWGAPMTDAEHARHACRAALLMRTEVEAINHDWKERHGIRIGIRFGINTGEMAVGNMGSNQVFSYTVLGDNVNLGSRLEGVNNIYGTSIIVGARTRELAGDSFVFRKLDVVSVKGRETPETIYELVAESSQRSKLEPWLHAFDRGLAAYAGMDWNGAEAAFRDSKKFRPDDKAADVFLERISQFREKSPGEGWQGVWKLTEK